MCSLLQSSPQLASSALLKLQKQDEIDESRGDCSTAGQPLQLKNASERLCRNTNFDGCQRQHRHCQPALQNCAHLKAILPKTSGQEQAKCNAGFNHLPPPNQASGFSGKSQRWLMLTVTLFALLITGVPHVVQAESRNNEEGNQKKSVSKTVRQLSDEISSANSRAATTNINTPALHLSSNLSATFIDSSTGTVVTSFTPTSTPPPITSIRSPPVLAEENYRHYHHQYRSAKNRRSANVEIVPQQQEAYNFVQHSQYMNSFFTYSDCDRIFISKSLNASHGTQKGTFEGPTLPRWPSPSTSAANESTTEAVAASTLEPHARQCIYTFVAGENERIRLNFTKFALRSEAPECFEEYIDLYTEMPDPKIDLLNTPFGGRFCDELIPHDRISLYHSAVIAFYTEHESTIGNQIFEGTYEFINATPYIAGTQMPNQVCSFAVYSDQRREGEFMSPTYPGVYPKDINCKYLFKGNPGQRVKLEFMDFDLFLGGTHCPMDFMKIYDGDSENAPLINTYCGQQRQLYVFSSSTSLFVHFSTMQRVAESINRGFSGYFEFSEKFVNLGFIGSNETSEHILGTECDQKILSRKESNGTIYSPNYPFLYHSNIQCKYYIYGLQDAQNLERINFQFEMLQIPTKDVNECADAYVRLYTQTTAMDEFDYIFCGEALPPPVVSEGPILMVVFNSGTSQGQGFKAHYWFETDYKIPGTQASPGQCQFSYMSVSGEKKGEFNSPRHPSNYPSSTFCTYEFFGEPDERVMIYFTNFNYADTDVTSQLVTGYNERCTQDWMEIHAIGPTGQEYFFGRFCSAQIPGPIITDRGVTQVKIVANTDDTEVSPGFLGNYAFIKENKVSKVKNCGGNLTYYPGEKPGGAISTPNYPEKYQEKIQQQCDWYITVAPSMKVSLYFSHFEVEGDQGTRGCANAVVRVWIDPLHDRPVELCGDKLEIEQRAFISVGNVLRVMFVTLSKKSIGGNGFHAIWNEVTKPIADDNSGSLDSSSSFVTVAGTEGGTVTSASSASSNNGSSGGSQTTPTTVPGVSREGAEGGAAAGGGGGGGGSTVVTGTNSTATGKAGRVPSRGRCPGAGNPHSASAQLVDGAQWHHRWTTHQHYPTSQHHHSLSFAQADVPNAAAAAQQSSSPLAPSSSSWWSWAQAGQAAPLSSAQARASTKPEGQQGRRMFHCAKNNLCISELLRCDGLQNCAYGDRSDEEGCVKDHTGQLGLLDLLGGLAGLTLFASFTLGFLCLTGIMIANYWYRREAAETEKEAAGTVVVAGNGGAILSSGLAGDLFSSSLGGGGGGGGGGASCSGSLHLSKMSTSACGSSLGGGVACGGSQSGTSYLVGHLSSPQHLYSGQLARQQTAAGALASIHPSASRTGSPRHLINSAGGGASGGSRHGSPFHHQQSRGTITTTGYSSELSGLGSNITPTHLRGGNGGGAGIIEVMTLGGSLGGSSAASQSKHSKWSTLQSSSSEGMPPNAVSMLLDGGAVNDESAGHHHHHSYLQQQQQHHQQEDSLDSPASNASIPPPPPPPTIGSASGAASFILAGGSRPTASSLASYYSERPAFAAAAAGLGTLPAELQHSGVTSATSAATVSVNIGSVNSIDRYAAYRTLGRPSLGGGGAGGGVTVPNTSVMATRQPTLPTFGYGPAQMSFHTLPHPPHHHMSASAQPASINHIHQQQQQQQNAATSQLNYLNQQQQQQQKKLSPSADSIMMLDQIVQTNLNVGASVDGSGSGSGGGLFSSGEHNGETLDEDDTSLSLRMTGTAHLQTLRCCDTTPLRLSPLI